MKNYIEHQNYENGKFVIVYRPDRYDEYEIARTIPLSDFPLDNAKKRELEGDEKYVFGESSEKVEKEHGITPVAVEYLSLNPDDITNINHEIVASEYSEEVKRGINGYYSYIRDWNPDRDSVEHLISIMGSEIKSLDKRKKELTERCERFENLLSRKLEE